MSAKQPAHVAVWFEIPAADFERAVAFYERTFETKLRREKMGPAEMAVFPHDGEAVSGCIMKGDGLAPAAAGSVVYIRSTADLNGALERASRSGGRVATPKTALPPGMGYFAHFIDSEGNRVGLHSME